MPADQAERRVVILSCSGSLRTYHRWIWGLGPVQRSVAFECASEQTQDFCRYGCRENKWNASASSAARHLPTIRESIVSSAVLLVNGRTNKQCCVKATVVQSRYSTTAQRLTGYKLVIVPGAQALLELYRKEGIMARITQPVDMHASTVETIFTQLVAMEEHLKYVTLPANDGAYWTIYPVVCSK